METRYQITKDGKVYGKDELPYYGKKLGIAFAQGRELWMDPLMVKPWTIDPDFENYKTEYDAELHEMFITSIKYGKKYEVSGKDAASRINSNGFGVTSTGGKTYIGLTRSSSQSPYGMLILYFLGNDDNPDSLIKKVIFMSPEWHEGRAIIQLFQRIVDSLVVCLWSVFPKMGKFYSDLQEWWWETIKILLKKKYYPLWRVRPRNKTKLKRRGTIEGNR
ncbi:MAG: hypothetical protein IPN15_03795 [Saprospiraceae bacterium]|nr:hypothetical protein [Candidatus Vicinibacter affinis]